MNMDEAMLTGEFAAIRDQEEKFLWVGKPHYVPYLASAVPALIFGAIWGSFDLMILTQSHHSAHAQGFGFIVPFLLLHAFPAWGSLLYVAWLALSYKNVAYAISNRRVILRSGVWAPNFQSFDYDQISEVDVTIGPLEKLMNCGTVRVNAGRVNAKGVTIFESMVAIDNPYDVYRLLKQTAVDVKTDWNYPNKLRPAENPGYQTDYKQSQQ